MSQQKSFAPMNSLVFVSDSNGGEPPTPIRGTPIWITSSCVAVACYPETDGETLFRLGAIAEVNPGIEADFDGLIETPSRSIAISTVDQETVLESHVTNVTTRVAIWRSHPEWPEVITIGFE